ncbi:hypothetical protein GEMRC1_010154 [Eukaryota sp. GEM-RC1]
MGFLCFGCRKKRRSSVYHTECTRSSKDIESLNQSLDNTDTNSPTKNEEDTGHEGPAPQPHPSPEIKPTPALSADDSLISPISTHSNSSDTGSISDDTLVNTRERFGWTPKATSSDLRSLLSTKPRKVATDIARIKEQLTLTPKGTHQSLLLSLPLLTPPPVTRLDLSPPKRSISRSSSRQSDRSRHHGKPPGKPPVRVVVAEPSRDTRQKTRVRPQSSRPRKTPISTPRPESSDTSSVKTSSTRVKTRPTPAQRSKSSLRNSSVSRSREKKVKKVDMSPVKRRSTRTQKRKVENGRTEPNMIVVDLSEVKQKPRQPKPKTLKSKSKPSRTVPVDITSRSPSYVELHSPPKSISIDFSNQNDRYQTPVTVAAKLAAFADAWDEINQKNQNRKVRVIKDNNDVDDDGEIFVRITDTP